MLRAGRVTRSAAQIGEPKKAVRRHMVRACGRGRAEFCQVERESRGRGLEERRWTPKDELRKGRAAKIALGVRHLENTAGTERRDTLDTVVWVSHVMMS